MANKPNLMQRGKSWVVYYRADGRQHWTSYKTKAEAELALARLSLKRAQGESLAPPTKISFRDFAARWLRHMQGRVSTKTFEGYEGVLRVHLLPELGHRLLSQITLEQLDDFLGDWLAAGPRFQERVRTANEAETRAAEEAGRPARKVVLGNSAKTVANAVVPLKAMLSQAVRWRYLAASPAAELRRPRVERRHDEMRPLSPSEVVSLLEAAPNADAKLLLGIAVATGMRRGEILGLRWGDVDWSRRRIHVRRSIGKDGRAQQPKSRTSIRAVDADGWLLKELRLHRMRSDFKADDDYVFASERGTPLDGNNMVRRYMAPALRRAKLGAVRFHDLRHTYASILIAQGAHPKLISERLGHASIQITLDRYGHLMDQSYGEAAGLVTRALFGDSAASVPQAEAVQMVPDGATARHALEAATA